MRERGHAASVMTRLRRRVAGSAWCAAAHVRADRRAGRRRRRRLEHDAALAHHDDAVGQLEQLVQVLAHQQHRGAALRAPEDAGVDLGAPPRSRGRRPGLATISTLPSPASSRASTARCTLPPDRLADRRALALRLDAVVGDPLARLRATAGEAQPAAPAAAAQRRLVEVAQRHVLGHAQVADAGVAQRLLGQAAHAAARRFSTRRAMYGWPIDAHRAGDARHAGRRAPRPARAGRCPRRRRCRRSRRRCTSRLRRVHGERAAIAHRDAGPRPRARPAPADRSRARHRMAFVARLRPRAAPTIISAIAWA